MAKYTKPELINYVWASSALPDNKPSPDASGNFTGTGLTVNVQEGWLQVKPPFEVENWIQNQQSGFNAYINQMGIPEWDTETEYQANKSYVQGSNNLIYKCIVTNTGRNPAAGNPSYWEVFSGNRAATSSQVGLISLASNAETQEGTVFNKAVTPTSLSSRTATTTRTGLVKLATDAEAQAGTSDSLAVTPSGLRGVLEVLFPVDSVVMRPTNPANSISNGGLGFGTWSRISGRVLLGAGTASDSRGESKTFTTGQTAGEYNHQLTTSEMPSHSHPISPSVVSDEGASVQGPNDNSDGTTVSGTGSTGGDSAHNNMQPYYVVDMWRRTA